MVSPLPSTTVRDARVSRVLGALASLPDDLRGDAHRAAEVALDEPDGCAELLLDVLLVDLLDAMTAEPTSARVPGAAERARVTAATDVMGVLDARAS